MYCLKCSMKLVRGTDNYVCSSGFLEYSKALSNKIDKLYISKSDDAKVADFSGNSFCPQCGCRLLNDRCNECDVSISEIKFDLIELHPHGTPKGDFY
jgi:hypothetical protein